ncbi:hypothetical protein DFH28DRAFT_922301 [Melampsora americana]|nr:hypothetical protein DFH28DRAFT_922301 [Melampsora americana]
MSPCLCLNCNSKASDYFLAQQTVLSCSNFTDLVLQHNIPEDYRHFEDRWGNLPTDHLASYGSIRQIGVADRLRQDFRYIQLFVQLMDELRTLFNMEYPQGGFYQLHDLFPISKIWNVCGNYDKILEGMLLDYIFGSEPLPSSYGKILTVLGLWTNSRNIVAVLKASEEEIRLQNKAIALAAEHEMAAQDAKKARSEARGVRLTQCSSTNAPTGQMRQSNASPSPTVAIAATSPGPKRKTTVKVARRAKKTKRKDNHNNPPASLAPPPPTSSTNL